MEEKSMKKTLYRSRNRILGGVCGGLAEYSGMDPSILRILVLIFMILTGGFPVVPIYIIAWLVIPSERR